MHLAIRFFTGFTLYLSLCLPVLAKDIFLSTTESDWVQQHRVIEIGVDPDWPPFEFIDEQGNYRGIAADYMKLIGQRLGIEFKVVPQLNWPEVIKRAKDKRLSVLPAVMKTPEREEYLLFTEAYLDFPMVIIQRQGAPFVGDLEALEGMNVSVVRNYVTHELLAKHHSLINLKPVDTIYAGLKALSTGEVDAYVGNLASISHAINKIGITNLKVSARTTFSYPLSIAVRDDWPELVSLIQKALNSISNAERQAISQKWIQVKLERGVDTRTVLLAALLIIVIVVTTIVVSVYKNKRLRYEVAERKNSEKKYRSLFETANDSIFILDGDRFIDCNPVALRMFGCNREDIIGRSPVDFSPFLQPNGNPSREMSAQVLTKASAGIPQHFEWQHKKLDGTLFDADVILNTIEINGNVYLQAIARDTTERKKAERELARLLMEHESVTNNIPDILYKTDNDGRFVWWNKSLEEVTGLSYKELYGQYTLKVICEEDYPVVKTFISNVMAKGYDSAEYRVITKAGPVLYQVKSIALKNESGEVIGRTGVARDISQQRKLEIALKTIAEGTTLYTGKEFFKALVENLARTLNVKFCFVGELVDTKNQIMRTIAHWNEGVVGEGIEYSLPGTPCENVISRATCVYTAGVQQLFPEDEMLVQMSMEGYAGAPVLDGKGEPLGIIVILDDKPLQDELIVRSVINNFAVRARVELERERVDAKLRQSAAVFENSDEGFMITDDKNNIVAVNRAFTEITGYSEGEVIGRNPAILRSGKQDTEFYAKMWQSLRKTEKWQGEIWNKRKNGEDYPEWLTISLIKNEEGNVLNHVGVFTDITKRVEADQNQRELQKQLQQAQKMEAVGQLAGGIAHDFNNILASILGYTDLARGLPAVSQNEKLNSYLDEVASAGKRARDLVGQMLIFSRGRHQEDKVSMQLGPIVDEAVNMLRPMLPSSIEINSHTSTEMPAVNVEPVQLHQLIMNLCINARDAMGEKGRIDIELSMASSISRECCSCHNTFSGDYVQLAVRDGGSGIDPKHLDQLFEPFFTTKEVGKGTGMGLSLVHGIVHDHNGHVLVESSPNGTVFRALFPFVEVLQNSDLKKSTSTIVLEKGKSQHIIVVDDEEAIGRYMKVLLENYQYQVSVFTDGEQAMSFFMENPQMYDLVITDQTMPVINGEELARSMLQVRPDLPIILCTGYSNYVDTKFAKNIGVKAFMQKPIDSNDMVSTVNNLLA